MASIDTHRLRSRRDGNNTKKNKQGPVFSTAKFGASLFGEKIHTTDCLTSFILERNPQSTKRVLNGKILSHPRKISEGQKRLLDSFGPEISSTPLLLALQLVASQLKNHPINPVTDATAADVVAVLNENPEALQRYVKSAGLKHPTEEQTQAFLDNKNNPAVDSVLSVTRNRL